MTNESKRVRSVVKIYMPDTTGHRYSKKCTVMHKLVAIQLHSNGDVADISPDLHRLNMSNSTCPAERFQQP